MARHVTFHCDFLHLVALTGAWADADPGADTAYHYRVAARNATGPGAPSATVPVTHTWQATDVPAVYNLAARGRGGGHWYRLLRLGHADNGPYRCRRWRWPPPGLLPVRIAGGPRQLTAAAVTYKNVLPTWQAHASGRTVTGYRRWPHRGRPASGPGRTPAS